MTKFVRKESRVPPCPALLRALPLAAAGSESGLDGPGRGGGGALIFDVFKGGLRAGSAPAPPPERVRMRSSRVP